MEVFTHATEWTQYLIRFLFFCFSLAFVFVLGHFRPEWKSRKAIISWMWTMVAIDTMLMNGAMAESKTGLTVIIGAILIILTNLVGDRVQSVKFKDIEARLSPANVELTQSPDDKPQEEKTLGEQK